MSEYRIIKEWQFDNVSDFKWCVTYGSEIEFVWKDKIYSITRNSDNRINICQIYKEETTMLFDTVDELLLYEIEPGELLKDIITKAEISSRTI